MPKVHIPTPRLLEVLASDECVGFCLSCGAEEEGVEPDAENYKCHTCGAMDVYGAEQVLITR